MFADMTELVHRGESAEDHPVAHVHMPAEGTAICQDHVIPDGTVMCDMRIRHKKAIVADRCLPCRGRAAIQRDKFAYNNAIADCEGRRFARIFEVLRRTSNRCEGIDLTVTPYTAAAMDDRVRTDTRSLTDCDIIFYDREGPDLDSVGEGCFWTYVRAWINLSSHYFVNAF